MSRPPAALAAASRAALGFAAMPAAAKRFAMQGAGFAVVASGGALTGYLAAGNKRGAVIGSLVHLSLYGTVGAFFGDRMLNDTERVVWGLLGLGSAVGAGYLLYSARGRRAFTR